MSKSQPFKTVKLPATRGKFVTVKFLRRALQAVLSRFNLSVEGGELIEEPDGQLHLRFNNADNTSDYPFKLAVVAGGVTVFPGVVEIGGTRYTPRINSTAITATPAPILALSSGYYTLWIRFRASAVFGSFAIDQQRSITYLQSSAAQGLPVTIVAVTGQNAVPPGLKKCQIDYSAASSDIGDFAVEIGVVEVTPTSTRIVSQSLRTNVSTYMLGDGTMYRSGV